MEKSMSWRSGLDERQLKEVMLAEVYARDFHHGTTGHNQLMLIAVMARWLDGPQSDEEWRGAAQTAYEAYGVSTGNKNYQGLPMPAWIDLTPAIQAAWIAAVKAVRALRFG